MVNIATARRRVMPSRINDSDYFPFEGGLNLVDTPLKIRPGQLLATKNYEPGIRGGYRSVRGYERYDGHPEPSQASYWIQGYERASAVATVGETISQLANVSAGVPGGDAPVLATVEQQPVTTINYALQSGALGVSPWGSSDITTTANATNNPIDGAETATLLRENALLTSHSAFQTIAKTPLAITYWYSRYVRAAGRSHGRLRVTSVANPSNICTVVFDLQNRTIYPAAATAGFVVHGQYLEEIGSGWFRVGLLFTSPAEASMVIHMDLADTGNATTYQGDGNSGMYSDAAQLEIAPPDSTGPSAYVASGSVAQGNGRGYYVLARLNGGYTDDFPLLVAGQQYAVADGAQDFNGADTDELDNAYQQLAIEDARAQIARVPGSGAILGVAVYNGVVYAFRNNDGATAARMYRQTPIGWSLVGLGSKLRFAAGLVAGIVEGDSVTGVASAAVGVIRRVVVQSGSFAGNDAAGYIVLAQGIVNGPFQNNESLQIGGTTRATAVGPSVAQTLQPNGRYEFRVHNFYGHTRTRRLYGVDGANRAFEFQDNPSTFVQIETGMTFDAPTHLAVHKNQLYLMFQGGSIQKSSVGDAVLWQVTLGAGELGIGDEGTGFLEEIGDTLFIFARNSTHYIFGTPDGDQLKPFNNEVGAFPGTIQRIGKGMYLDDRGFSSLAATQSYGNYAYNSISQLIQPLIKQLKLQSTCSVTVKDDNLYRVFFADGRFISIGIQDKKISGFTSCEYPHIVRCAFAGEDASGEQLIVFGSDDGFVYRAERGTSFDGQDIETFMRPVYFFSRTPSRRKRYRRAQFDIRAAGDLTIEVAVDYSFGDADDPAEAVRNIQLGGGGGIWGSAIWGQFKWGQGQAPEAILKLEGSGINIGFLIASRSKVAEPHSLEGVNLHHSQRRINRGTSYA
jgi:hypothetical protein